MEEDNSRAAAREEEYAIDERPNKRRRENPVANETYLPFEQLPPVNYRQ
jgi:hypothetical protein